MRQWLRDIRKASNLTHAQVAEKSKISRVHYTNIENGNRSPMPDIAKNIDKALNFKAFGIDWTKFYE